MRLVTYDKHDGGGEPAAGVLLGDEIAPAGASVRDALRAGTPVRYGDERIPLSAVRLLPPVPDPEKIICLGLNYRAHAAETGFEPPRAPMLFAKYRNSLAGHDSAICIPAVTDAVDYEGELAVVIGRRCARVTPGDALDYVAGAMPFNDVTARDLQFRTSQWLAGKALDTFAPCGPDLVLSDEIGDLQQLEIATRLNGETMQSANTADMIFSVAETVAFLSELMTLEPGDIIATGTPAGVGYTRTPPISLRDGDIVEVEIQGVGTLRNTISVESTMSPRTALVSLERSGP
jgi:2-keto-4-pentenoate hydratase/2-oxohepta-3-ene-1,7-dioic acid hydratase in catechol pathway